MGMASVKKQDTWNRGCVNLGQIQSCLIPQTKLRLLTGTSGHPKIQDFFKNHCILNIL